MRGKRAPLAERVRLKFHERPDPDACWVWEGFKDKKGYGRIWNPGGSQYAHVVVYELEVGPVPPGHEVDHTCNNTSCVRPEHLEAVTGQENTHRRDLRLGNPASRITHCINGHERNEIHTYTNKHGHVVCRTCAHERYLRKKATKGGNQ